MKTQNSILAAILVTSLVGVSAFSYVNASSTGTTSTRGAKISNQSITKGMFGKGMKGGHGVEQNLTDAEKTALTSMTDAQKQAFFEKKRTEQEAKKEARESVIDKKLSDQTLTATEKTLLAEIVKERAAKKLEKQERKAAMEAIQPILDKKRAGTTLTTDEQAKLTAFETKYPHSGKGGKGGKKGGFDGRK